ncbi:MAG: hypothetical protein ACP5IE_10495, partial [Infirmifilum sp.]
LTTPILESVLRDRVKAINQEELDRLPSGRKKVRLRLLNVHDVFDKVSKKVSTYGILSQFGVKKIKRSLLMDVLGELENILSKDTKRGFSMNIDRLFDNSIRLCMEKYVKIKRVQQI